MKLRAFIKSTLKGIIRDLPTFIFVFAVFPIILSILYGYFQREMFNPPNEMKKIPIVIEDKDKSVLSASLKNFLTTNTMKNIIEISQKDWKYKLVIPKDYEECLKNSRECKISVIPKQDKSKTKEKILASIINKYHEELESQILIKEKISRNNISENEKQKLFNQINSEIYNVYKEKSIQNNIVTQNKGLTSYEYYSISIFSFMFIVLIISLSASYYAEKEAGIFKRILSTTLSKTQYFNYSIINCFITAVILNSIYVFGYRIMGLSFNRSIPLLLAIILLQSLLASVLSGLIIAFIKEKKTLNIISGAFVMLSVTVGGAFWPIDKTSNSVIKFLSNFSPNVLVIKTYKNYLLYNSFHSIKFYSTLFVVIAAVVYSISIFKVRVKWGE